MADESFFQGLPPPAVHIFHDQSKKQLEDNPALLSDTVSSTENLNPGLDQPPKSILKSSLKRSRHSESSCKDNASEKQLKFKTLLDTPENQIIEAMQKIASHICNPEKFNKASKLALHLVEAGSVNCTTSSGFFSILEAAMSVPKYCMDPSLRSCYHTLFSAAQDIHQHFDDKQKNQLEVWTIKAVIANDFFTDDSFVFSKAAGRVKDAISSLPLVTEEDDIDEGVGPSTKAEIPATISSLPCLPQCPLEVDPFKLDALFCTTPKDLDKKKERKNIQRDHTHHQDSRETVGLLRSKREALITCLDAAAGRYKLPWCQTVVDMLVKHAFDNRGRFGGAEREGIEKLWVSVREQQVRRKQGKGTTGKLDVNTFEWLQHKYAGQKISIRRAVGGAGDRRTEQWLG